MVGHDARGVDADDALEDGGKVGWSRVIRMGSCMLLSFRGGVRWARNRSNRVSKVLHICSLVKEPNDMTYQ